MRHSSHGTIVTFDDFQGARYAAVKRGAEAQLGFAVAAREVEVTDEPREPVQDPRLGIEGDVDAKETLRHRLVAIGTSLTHGFQRDALYNTELAYPAIIAREMGWYDPFRHPCYFGQLL